MTPDIKPLSLRAKVALWVDAQIKHDKALAEYGNISGVVYFAKANGTDLWKVGFSRVPSGVNKRIRSMQTGCPFEIVLKAVKPQSSEQSESNIHSLMQSFRFRGEWFYGNEWIRQIVKQWAVK